MLSSSHYTMLIVDQHWSDIWCDEFPVPQIDHKRKQVQNSDMKNFICSDHGERLVKLEVKAGFNS